MYFLSFELISIYLYAKRLSLEILHHKLTQKKFPRFHDFTLYARQEFRDEGVQKHVVIITGNTGQFSWKSGLGRGGAALMLIAYFDDV